MFCWPLNEPEPLHSVQFVRRTMGVDTIEAAKMAADRQAHPALRRGAQLTRLAEPKGGVFAASRLDGAAGEYLVVFNTETRRRTLDIAVDPRSERWTSVAGRCAKASAAPGVASIDLAPLSFVVCRSNAWSR